MTLVEEAVRQGGAIATTIGFIAGAIVYVVAIVLLERHGARHPQTIRRSGDQQPSEDEQSGSGSAIAIGALLDGIPESVVLGVSLLGLRSTPAQQSGQCVQDGNRSATADRNGPSSPLVERHSVDSGR